MVEQGILSRKTGETAMHSHSSRSHAILTLTLTQTTSNHMISSKISLIDLAGSERMKRTHIDPSGLRFQESIVSQFINVLTL